MIQYAWLLPLLPLLAFAVTGLFTGRSKNLTVGIVVGGADLVVIFHSVVLKRLAGRSCRV